MLHCHLRVRWKVASDLRFQAAISEPKTSSLCGISGDLALSTRKSLAIAIVRFWCAKKIHPKRLHNALLHGNPYHQKASDTFNYLRHALRAVLSDQSALIDASL